ncbi:MAG: NFACT family protein [Clostridia bacterium]|nr:NFACT family protein [Clostridia bacterium]
MPLDAVALGAIAHELNTELKGAKIEKIHQPERDEILLVLKAQSGGKKLTISASSANSRIHLVTESKENPATPPMFCMLLRKHLTGGRVESVTRLGFERVIDIEISSRNEMGDIISRHLICEVMGRNSNIIFLDENRKIIDSVKHIDLTVSSVRNILPGLLYMMPPDTDRLNPETATEDEYFMMLANAPEGREADRAITDHVKGISPLLAGECVYRACNQRNLFIGELTTAQKGKIAYELFGLFEKASKYEFSPCIIYSEDEKKTVDFAPFEIKQYESAVKIKNKKTMNEAACEFYFARDLHSRMNDRSGAITKIVTNNIRRAQKKLDILQGELKEAGDREKLKISGDLITANLYKIKKGDEKLITQNFYDADFSEIEIKLDNKLTPSQNATRYYTRYKKAKNTEIYAAKQMEITIKELEYLESVLYSVSNAQTPSHLAEIRGELVANGYIKSETNKKKKEKNLETSKPYEFLYKGYTIYVGRNNIQNDILTLKMSRSRDLWLHAKNIAGSHTLVKYMGEEFPNDVIEVAASLAAFYSKGKNSPYLEVDYCPVNHVKKPNGAKSGMVIYEGYNTAFVKPDGALAEKLIKK